MLLGKKVGWTIAREVNSGILSQLLYRARMHLETIYENESSERDEGLEDSIVEELDEPPIDRYDD